MAQLKLSIRDICRVAIDHRITNREVARIAGVSPTTVNKYRSLMKMHVIDRSNLDCLSQVELECQSASKFDQVSALKFDHLRT
jgi:DNA-binding Xre family transcriptional regulator